MAARCGTEEGPPLTGKAPAAATATGHFGGCLRRRQPYSQEVGPVPKCKRRLPVPLVAALAAAGVCTATSVAATVDGDDGPNRLVGTPEADVIRAFGGNDRVRALGGNDTSFGELGPDRLGGGRGNDMNDGGPDRDRLRGGPGNDVQNGGDHNDRM